MTKEVTSVLHLVYRKGEFYLGNSKGLMLQDPDDTKHFRDLTLHRNIIMGKNTMKTLTKRLPSRTNYYLESKKQRLPLVVREKLHSNSFIPISSEEISQIDKPIVIGGSKCIETYKDLITKWYITITTGYAFDDTQGPFVKFEFPDQNFKVELTRKIVKESYTMFFFEYTKIGSKSKTESEFKRVTESILNNGVKISEDRTRVGTLSTFGETMRFDLQGNVMPLTSLRNIPFNLIVSELLWILRGSTDSRELELEGNTIWKLNSSSEFIKSRNLVYPQGELGPIYGFSLRHFGGDYNRFKQGLETGFDQLKYICDILEKGDYWNRRMVISYWDPSKLDEMVLPPCHYTVTFTVLPKGDQKVLNCLLVMRSSDELARSWNCTFYSILTCLLAKKYNLLPGELVWIGGNCHIYTNHIEDITRIQNKPPRPPCHIEISDRILSVPLHELTKEDITLINYFPHPRVYLKMAV